MLFRTRAINGTPISRSRLHHIKKQFKFFSNGVIRQNREALRYLSLKQAKGCCFSEDIIFLTKSPSVSCVLEELMHAIQFKRGLYNQRLMGGNALAGLLCELEVAQVLHKNRSTWKIPPMERAENLRRLILFRANIKKQGGLSWLSSSKSQKSRNFLAQELQSLTGRFWLVR